MNLNSYLGKQQSYGANPMDYFDVLDTPQATSLSDRLAPLSTGYNPDISYGSKWTGQAPTPNMWENFTGFLDNNKDALNFGKSALGGLGDIFKLGMGMQGLKLAQQQASDQRRFAEENLRRQQGVLSGNIQDKEQNIAAFTGRAADPAAALARYGIKENKVA